MRLTDATIKGLPHPQSGQRFYRDDLIIGFGVRVSQRAKVFTLVKNRRWKTLGRYPDLSLSQAREKARKVISEFNGDHPPLTFAEAFDEYKTRHIPRLRTAYEAERILRVRFLPHISHRKLEDLTARDIAPIIDRIKRPHSARAAFGSIRAFLNWCIKQDYIDRSPIARLTPVSRPESRDRVLSDEELLKVWNAATDGVYGAIVRLLILTGQRRSQFGSLQRHFVDMDKMVITWPAEAMKQGRRHTIPITPMVKELLPQVIGADYRGWNHGKTRLDKQLGFKFRVHDFRRTWATIAVEQLGVAPHIADAVLAHTVGNSVSRTYIRATYLEPMRQALTAFEGWLTQLVAPCGVAGSAAAA